MKLVLVDTSIWIDFFRGHALAEPLHALIENNQIATNELILAELLPSIRVRGEDELSRLLLSVTSIPLAIDWQEIVQMQTANLKAGHNHVGIPDLIIAQNALSNHLVLFENDQHFRPLRELFGLELWRSGSVA